MPCSKAMRGCRRDCLHRQMVLEYRDARDAYDAQLEAATSMYDAEVADYKRDHPGPTFKAWLEGIKGRNRDPDAA